MAEGLITPDELGGIAEEMEKARLREALEKKRKADEERRHLHDAFMAEAIPPTYASAYLEWSKAPPSGASVKC